MLFLKPQAINAAGVARMVRQLTVLQPGLAAAGAAGGQFRPEAVRVFERARTYYTLLTYSADSLVKVAADRPGRFTPSEYLALLQVRDSSTVRKQKVYDTLYKTTARERYWADRPGRFTPSDYLALLQVWRSFSVNDLALAAGAR